MDPIIIVGTGLAGYQLAREFRRVDTATPLLLVSADAGNFYSKPLLSTALTSGKTSATLTTATPEAMAQQLAATILPNTTVTGIDAANKTITLDGKEIAYSKLVMACGADVIKAKLEGDGAADVMSVNHLYHYALFQELIKNKKNITILGAGLIGCEFANDLSNAGYEVHVIAPAVAPLDLLIPHSIGKLLQDHTRKLQYSLAPGMRSQYYREISRRLSFDIIQRRYARNRIRFIRHRFAAAYQTRPRPQI